MIACLLFAHLFVYFLSYFRLLSTNRAPSEAMVCAIHITLKKIKKGVERVAKLTLTQKLQPEKN